MKTIIIAWIAAITAAGAAIHVDGRGFHPVMVQVVDANSGSPIKGAIVRLEGAGTYEEQDSDPNRQTKVLPESLGRPVATNAEGVAVVFFYGGWSSTTTDEKTTYSRPLLGTVVVVYEGKEIYRSNLEEWAKKNQYKVDGKSAPWIIVSPEKPK